MLISLVVLVTFAVLVVLTITRLNIRPRTSDGYLEADIVHLAPDVSGRIVRLDVTDNQFIQRGDPQFTIDQEPYRYRVDQAPA